MLARAQFLVHKKTRLIAQTGSDILLKIYNSHITSRERRIRYDDDVDFVLSLDITNLLKNCLLAVKNILNFHYLFPHYFVMFV